MTCDARVVSESVDVPADVVYGFACRMENLPQWASGLAAGISHEGGAWYADSPMGRVKIALAPPNDFGMLDHDVTLPNGVTVHNTFRVTPAADGCLLSFVVLRLSDVTTEAFEKDVAHVARDLKALKTILERASGQGILVLPEGLRRPAPEPRRQTGALRRRVTQCRRWAVHRDPAGMEHACLSVSRWKRRTPLLDAPGPRLANSPTMHDPQRPRPVAVGDAWSAAQYTRNSALQETMAQQALAPVGLRGDEHVLDVGCGDGRISAHIARHLVPHGSVCGIDVSPDMIDFARRRHASIANLQFTVVDARQMPFDARFEAAVSFNALHWVPDLEPALRGLRTALVPGGRAWLRLVTQGPVTSIETVAEQVRREAPWAPLFDGFDDPYLRLEPQQLVASVTGVGLQVLDLRTQLESWDFGSHAALSGFCRAGFGAWTKVLPADRRDSFVEAVLVRYLASRDDVGETVLRFYQTDLALAA